jgi:outer membrane receptor protein involved in Fe transport
MGIPDIIKPTHRWQQFARVFVASLGIAASAAMEDSLEWLIVDAEPVTVCDSDLLIGLADSRDLRDVMRMLPNASSGGAPGTLFSARGVALEGVLIAGNRTSPALIVMNGLLPRTTNSMWVIGVPMWDLAEVEFAAGPQLFHRGPSAAGGLFQLTPQLPQFEESGTFRAEAGNLGMYQIGATHNAVIIPDKLAVRLNLFADGNDGGVTNVADGDKRFASSDRLLARGQLRWLPTGHEMTSLDVLVEGIKMRGNPLGFAGNRPDFDLFDRKVNLNQHEQSPADHLAVTLHFQTEIDGNRRIESWLAGQRSDGFQLSDLDNSPTANWWAQADVLEQRLSGGTILHHEGPGFNGLIGAFADRGVYKLDYFGRGFSETDDGDPFFTSVRETVEMASIFARGEYEFHSEWWAFAGIRLEGQRRSVDIQSSVTGIRSRERVQSIEPLPEIGMEWRGVAATTGLKLARYVQPRGISYGLLLGQTEHYESAQGWEIETYSVWSVNTLRIAPRAFYSALKDTQVSLPALDGVASLDRRIVNVGNAVRYGAELEIAWQGPGALTLAAQAGWLHTEVDAFRTSDAQRAAGPLPNAPKWNAGLVCAWNPKSGWFGQSALTWQEQTYSQFSAPKTTRIEDRLELSARIGYRWDQVELYAFGNNLFDRDFALVRRDFTETGGQIQGSPSLPRVIGIGMAIDW